MKQVSLGIDVISSDYWINLKGRNLGLLSNQASLNSKLQPSRIVINKLLPGGLKALFGPQHGIGGEDQDNMIETGHNYDHKLNIPIFSLYSSVRDPEPEMLDLIDVLIIDLQDVGTRVYTFATTMLHCLKAASIAGKEVIVLDRPNPIGGEIVEGNMLRKELYSFVGPGPVPMRHGLTLGELAILFNNHFNLDVNLSVVPMKGWHRKMNWNETGLRWIMPSPNMPSSSTSQVYPGQVIWEGTNISEGRGTCKPFEIFGAPFIEPEPILNEMPQEATRGCHLQTISFRPTFHKWSGELCKGFMIHITDPHIFRPYLTTISLLSAIIKKHGELFEWKEPPYEYEFEKMPIDLIIGDSSIRKQIEKGASPLELNESWFLELDEYLGWREPFLLY